MLTLKALIMATAVTGNDTKLLGVPDKVHICVNGSQAIIYMCHISECVLYEIFYIKSYQLMTLWVKVVSQ
jgi:hypothetical protein